MRKVLVDYEPERPIRKRSDKLCSLGGERPRGALPAGRSRPAAGRFRPDDSGDVSAARPNYAGSALIPGSHVNASGAAGETIEVEEFKLERGREIVLRVVDTEGRPVADAQVDVPRPGPHVRHKTLTHRRGREIQTRRSVVRSRYGG